MGIGPTISGGHHGHHGHHDRGHDGHDDHGHHGHVPVEVQEIRQLIQDFKNALHGDVHGLLQPLGQLIRAAADDAHLGSWAAPSFSPPVLHGSAPAAGTAHADTVSASLWPHIRNDGGHGPGLFIGGAGADSLHGGGFGTASFGNSTLTGAQSGLPATAGATGPTVQASAGNLMQILGNAGAAADFDPAPHATFVTGSNPAHHNAAPAITQAGPASPIGSHAIRLSDGTEITFTSLPAHNGGHAT